MRQSKLFTKTIKEIPSSEKSLNSILLLRGGFVDKLMAGVYTFLPLGLRVLTKIENIIREEMNAIGGQEIYMSALCPKDLWKQTKRLDKVDVLFEARGANNASRKVNSSSYVLNSTHEEVVTPLIKKFASSYKDLPVSVYQIQTKFRNEPRPKSGLLRGREFRMKDLYSFHKDEKDLKEYYEKVKEAYSKIFKRLGIGNDTYVALASGGDFTKDYSHEFQTKCPTGEDTIFKAPGSGICFNREVTPSLALEKEIKEKLKPLKEIETKNVVSVEALVKFLDISIEKTVKTLLYENDKSEILAVALRGDYDVNEEKLQKITESKFISLLSKEKIKKITKAKVGYAGLLDLPKNVRVVIDNSLENMVNFEMGANKTNYHVINVNFGRDLKRPDKFYDVKLAKKGDLDPETKKPYEVFKASEVGNIFPLNIKFTKFFNYNYTKKNGENDIVYMGCYGLGSTRVMGVLAEKFSNDSGLMWPEAVAPFKVHLISLGQNKEADKIYKDLNKTGIEVLYDDREDVSAGKKFADADLIGCPFRIVVSKKTLESKSVEFKKRSETKTGLIKIGKIVKVLK